MNPKTTAAPDKKYEQQMEHTFEGDYAVIVRHAYKHYGSKRKPVPILVNFSMTITRGTIYGLLGPSGAGKTTLLACLIGRKKLNAGNILVLGRKPRCCGASVPGKRVGYMPQELSLYAEFTMKDLMLYFGRIYNMKEKNIEERTQFLMDLLDLKTRTRKIKNLSGGQQRRVSLAIALLHNAELLILDEPTVGVDPVLRQTIWTYLVNLVKEGHTTVIITTHYIEEAKEAHKIGLMRHGRLLAEDSPSHLLQLYKESSLEMVFLTLSQNSNNPSPKEEPLLNLHDFELKFPPRRTFKEAVDLKCSQLRALIFKNFLTMWRNPGIILFFLGLPVVQILLFCIAIGGEPNDLLLAVVNEEVVDAANNCPFSDGCTMRNLSCRYLAELDLTTIDLKYVSSVDEGKHCVEDNKCWGVIKFSEQFSIATLMRPTSTNNSVIEQSQIKSYLDASDQQINYIIKRDLMHAYNSFSRSLLRDCGMSEKLVEMPIKSEQHIYGTDRPVFRDFAAPGIIITIVFFLSVGQTAISLIAEQVEGMLDRTVVAGVSMFQILLSHVICQMVIMLFQAFIVLFVTLQICHIPCEGPLVWLIAIVGLVGICGMCYGYMISSAFDVERTAIEIALGSFYPCIILSGVIWPIEGMHYILRIIAYGTPLTFSIRATRSIMTRGWDIHKPSVYYGIIAPLTWIAIFLFLTMMILKLKRG